MAQDIGLRAILEPAFDDRAIDRETDRLEKELEDAASDVGVDLDTEKIGEQIEEGGKEGMRRIDDAFEDTQFDFMPELPEMPGTGQDTDTDFGVLSDLSTKDGLLKVALGGALAVGILKGVQKLADASPMMARTVEILSSAMALFFRPFGDFLGRLLEPVATWMLDMAVRFNELAEDEGLAIAVVAITGEALEDIGEFVFNAIADMMEDIPLVGEPISEYLESVESSEVLIAVGLASLLIGAKLTALVTKVAASALITAVKLTALVGKVAVSKLLSAVSIAGLLKAVKLTALVLKVGAAALIGAVSAKAILTAVAIAALIIGGIYLWNYIEGPLRDVWHWIETPVRSVWDWIETPVRSIWDWISFGGGSDGGTDSPGPGPGPDHPPEGWEPPDHDWDETEGGEEPPGPPDGAPGNLGGRRNLARGGIVRSPTDIRAGEAGPEAILPIDDLLDAIAGDDGGRERMQPQRASRTGEEVQSALKAIERALRDLDQEVRLVMGTKEVAQASTDGKRRYIDRTKVTK